MRRRRPPCADDGAGTASQEQIGSSNNGTVVVESTFDKLRECYPKATWLAQTEDLGKLVLWAAHRASGAPLTRGGAFSTLLGAIGGQSNGSEQAQEYSSITGDLPDLPDLFAAGKSMVADAVAHVQEIGILQGIFTSRLLRVWLSSVSQVWHLP